MEDNRGRRFMVWLMRGFGLVPYVFIFVHYLGIKSLFELIYRFKTLRPSI
jgi:hypothetical protein